MSSSIRVAILEDHQSIIDGYTYRLGMNADIKIVGTSLFGNELEPMLAQNQVDVLLMDLSIPISQENHNVFPVRHALSKIRHQYPDLKIIIISVFNQNALVRAMVEMGVRGYIVKDDQNSIKNLARIVKIVADDGVYFSADLQVFSLEKEQDQEQPLTPRQMEVLSLCIAYPNLSATVLAREMNITSSTFRNLLSDAYRRLGVRTRNAAVVCVQERGIIMGKAKDNQAYK